MLLKNKKTGEIVEPRKIGFEIFSFNERVYDSLAELNAEWEDAPEEPFSTSFYTIVDGKIKHCIFYNERVAGCPDDAWAYIKDDGRECIKQLKEVGLYFGTKEEAELTVRKLKAWKRLKDFGCRFMLDDHFTVKFVGPDARKITSAEEQKSLSDSYKSLFGGEE